ncbi:MAG TPA: RNA polymerase sigma-70 factor [Marmoricola sp.]|nr:RNA polymerase sigma-70 factor [Marmoricola sp.]
MTRTDEFQELRPQLFAIAYRILGSVSEAEDAVQETWMRFDAADVQPRSTKAFLATIVTRVSLGVLRSSRVRRERYVGEWLPEPLVTDPYEDPERVAELADSVSMASLLLLERLSPLERAVFVLREVFGYGFAEVAAAVERSEAACRQLAMRARRHMDEGRPRFEADPEARDRLADQFFAAVREGDVDGLRRILTDDVSMAADSGGKAPQWRHRVLGPDKVARVLAAMIPPLGSIDVTFERHRVNGQPGAIFRDRDDRVLSAWSVDVVDGQIQAIRTVLNPDKLRHVGPVGDAWAVRREVHDLRRRAR